MFTMVSGLRVTAMVKGRSLLITAAFIKEILLMDLSKGRERCTIRVAIFTRGSGNKIKRMDME